MPATCGPGVVPRCCGCGLEVVRTCFRIWRRQFSVADRRISDRLQSRVEQARI